MITPNPDFPTDPVLNHAQNPTPQEPVNPHTPYSVNPNEPYPNQPNTQDPQRTGTNPQYPNETNPQRPNDPGRPYLGTTNMQGNAAFSPRNTPFTNPNPNAPDPNQHFQVGVGNAGKGAPKVPLT